MRNVLPGEAAKNQEISGLHGVKEIGSVIRTYYAGMLCKIATKKVESC